MKKRSINLALLLALSWGGFTACTSKSENTAETAADSTATSPYLSEPLVNHIFTADPSAHVFDGKIYIYPSHDVESDVKEDDLGSHFDMKDYHVLSMDSIGGKVTDHGVALDIKDVPWAGKQMWAPDAAHKDGKYYLYFPAKDKEGIFKIGVAVSDNPAGPFKAEPQPMGGSFSIDPAVFDDGNGNFYMYFGGIWGGQLQYYSTGKLAKTEVQPADSLLALTAKVVKLSADMKSFAEPVRDLLVVDEKGRAYNSGEHDQRFFEASWVHKFNGKYYFTYSTGDTHFINYAIGDNPYGPFAYKGVVLNPVQGWTNHHSIVEVGGKWYIFYHDTQLSGKTHLRNIKVTELVHNADGSIQTITPYKGN